MEGQELEGGQKEKMAISMARSSAITQGQVLSPQEMKNLVDALFACSAHNFSPTGKSILQILSFEEIDNRFK